ncbi:L,D-transpeptidase family protein [Jeongeupia naejangsanensis]|uniref:L,D-transpeptidase n=1 Tax=Jeongeupia naejangsanensis TaxID=613195 RepID=A0ABS2BI48_9NEIS|nr:L,D-transpeptidase [Jeongeupia naejangsanensis]MBM3115287.1 L,D-transpeptidase [Jeongeupia naejangsanensis]
MSSTLSRARRLIAVLLLLVLAPAAQPKFTASMSATLDAEPSREGRAAKGTPEQMIVAAIDAIRAGRMRDARATVDALLVREPDYRLAHLLSADLYAMHSGPLRTVGGAASGPADLLEGLRHEAMARVQASRNPPPPDAFPANLLILAPKQHHAVVVETDTSRVYLFSNEQGVPKRIADFYTTIGKLGVDKLKEGDQRTPLGVYFVTSEMPRTQLDAMLGKKADLYGIGAWPISYPNELDIQQGRTGHGIWLHGVPYDTYARSPWSSNGCVALGNEDMQALSSNLQVGVTPVVIVRKINWLARSTWQQQRQAALAMVDQGQSGALPEDLSVFGGDVAADQRVATFDDAGMGGVRRQYWQRTGSDWRVVWDGPAKSG